jgi:hypothetical protein
VQFNDQPQHVTIGISSDDLPAAAICTTLRARVHAADRQKGRSAPPSRPKHDPQRRFDHYAQGSGFCASLPIPSPAGRYAWTRHFVKSRCYVDNFLDKIWTKLMTNRQKGLAARTAKTW